MTDDKHPELARKFDALKVDVLQVIDEAEAAGDLRAADEFRATLRRTVRPARAASGVEPRGRVTPPCGRARTPVGAHGCGHRP